MWITVLKAKLHTARVTHSNPDYDGSLAVDMDLMRQAGIHQHEQLHVYNLDNAERFVTYAIAAAAGSGIISANGAAAHLASVGHRVIVCAYRSVEEKTPIVQPRLVYLDENNQVKEIKAASPLQEPE